MLDINVCWLSGLSFNYLVLPNIPGHQICFITYYKRTIRIVGNFHWCKISRSCHPGLQSIHENCEILHHVKISCHTLFSLVVHVFNHTASLLIFFSSDFPVALGCGIIIFANCYTRLEHARKSY